VPQSMSPALRKVLEELAPGTMLRDAIERIIGAGRGALIVLAYNDDVAATISGGFRMNANATPQRLAELAKMDGALVLDLDAEHIHYANVHLVPDASIPTNETGTRHRSAERVAKQTGAAVISVSESMARVTLYVGDEKHVLEDVSSLLSRANQALATLERYRTRLTEVTTRLSARELEDEVTLRDVCTTLQRSEMVRRIGDEVAGLVTELGREGRLIELQRAELMSEVGEARMLLLEDYRIDRRRKLDTLLRRMADLSSHDLLDLTNFAAILGHDDRGSLDTPLQPRGYRLLSRIPRLPDSVIEKIVQRFGTMQQILGATHDELQAVDGVGEARATSILEGLRRLLDSTVVDP
jgi:diadenylate cyclase